MQNWGGTLPFFSGQQKNVPNNASPFLNFRAFVQWPKKLNNEPRVAREKIEDPILTA
jgi:hypothetical protein